VCTSNSVVSTPGNRRCTQAIALQASPTKIACMCSIFVLLKFKRADLNLWYMATSKQAYTRAQCSHASVGLTQARPNNRTLDIKVITTN